jgi:hypothetical protein
MQHKRGLCVQIYCNERIRCAAIRLSPRGLTGGSGTRGAEAALLAVRQWAALPNQTPRLDKDLRAAAPALSVAVLGAR